mmetsp:Transcript_11859/g.22891  ORF Transcript_11859/g.22891 Transcript_11859/m.22891 type:complete len:241 (-) Transcript_11859:108-830(-)
MHLVLLALFRPFLCSHLLHPLSLFRHSTLRLLHRHDAHGLRPRGKRPRPVQQKPACCRLHLRRRHRVLLLFELIPHRKILHVPRLPATRQLLNDAAAVLRVLAQLPEHLRLDLVEEQPKLVVGVTSQRAQRRLNQRRVLVHDPPVHQRDHEGDDDLSLHGQCVVDLLEHVRLHLRPRIGLTRQVYELIFVAVHSDTLFFSVECHASSVFRSGSLKDAPPTNGVEDSALPTPRVSKQHDCW